MASTSHTPSESAFSTPESSFLVINAESSLQNKGPPIVPVPFWKLDVCIIAAHGAKIDQETLVTPDGAAVAHTAILQSEKSPNRFAMLPSIQAEPSRRKVTVATRSNNVLDVEPSAATFVFNGAGIDKFFNHTARHDNHHAAVAIAARLALKYAPT